MMTEYFSTEHIDTIVFDLGGVLMTHNMRGCIDAFLSLMGKEAMTNVLGLGTDGEGAEGTLMEKYELGNISTDDFINGILCYCKTGTTFDDVKKAWITMHGEIPADRLDYLRELKHNNYRLFMLSNNNELHWADVMTKYHLDKYFDKMFASHIMHCSKPSRLLFEEVAKQIGVESDRVIFIDDLLANRQMAQEAVGWRTCDSVETLKKMRLTPCR
ncbi:MAG: HAD hydrolase-like protein [Paludibacteraceae bacterium]|nr:HAD hydrolase-like protein [Paludibacteraceae bacterium]